MMKLGLALRAIEPINYFQLGKRNMNRRHLIDAITGKTGQTKIATREQLDALVDIITGSLVKGGTVQLIGFGSFSTGSGRNPKTGEKIRIAATKTAKFAAGKAFRETMNKRADGKR
jgi:DNA-binding protein HU-beta